MNPRERVTWHVWTLRLASVHCIAWGAGIMLFPASSADVYGFEKPVVDVHLWQGTGLVILLFGIGYGIASTDPRQHWAVVAIGLLGKILGPMGMAWTVWQGDISSRVLWLLPLNDVVWWLPFAAILRSAFHKSTGDSEAVTRQLR
ncbi:MAG: hypothetical protein R3C19_11015 [Planctomycetaceae bacterium]